MQVLLKKKVQQYREEKQKEYDEHMEECKKQGDYMINFCELMHEAFKPQNIITEDEVEETIRRIDYYSILIMSFGYQGKIDLNQLKSYDDVVSIGLYPSTGSLPSSIQNYKKIQ